MNAKDKVRLGSALMLVGLLVVVAGTFTSLGATVTYQAPDSFTFITPQGTSSSPILLVPGQSISVQADVASSHAASFLTVTLNGLPGGTSYIGLSNVYQTDAQGGYEFVGTWVVPSSASGAYTFTFKSYDSYDGETITQDDYFTVAVGQPAGYCTINGQQVTTSSSLTVNSPGLTFACFATSNQNLVDYARVIVYDSSGNVLSNQVLNLGSGSEYGPASYTLPGYGTYTIDGYFIVVGGRANVQLMSLLGSWGQPSSNGINLLQVMGGLLFVGGFLIRRKSKTNTKA